MDETHTKDKMHESQTPATNENAEHLLLATRMEEPMMDDGIDYDTRLQGDHEEKHSSQVSFSLDGEETMMPINDIEAGTLNGSMILNPEHKVPGELSVSFKDVTELQEEKQDKQPPIRRTSKSESAPGDIRRGLQRFPFTQKEMIDLNSRVTKTVDLETGREGARAQCAVVRDEDERFPQMRRRRLQTRAKRAVRNRFWKKEEPPPEDDEHEMKKHKADLNGSGSIAYRAASHIPINDDTQYRLVSVDAKRHDDGGNFVFSPGFYEELMVDEEKGCSCFGFQPNELVVSYLFWAFRSSFLAVLLSAAVWFFTVTILFSLVIYAIGMSRPECIHVNGVEFNSAEGAAFMDAYALSWTTFSTVGYGLVYPSTSTLADAHKCFPVTIVCTAESFVGILIASFWGAIFLSKVTRVSSFAQVTFSSPLLVRYGHGVGAEEEDAEDMESRDSDGSASDEEEFRKRREMRQRQKRRQTISQGMLSRIPCPVLEFRLINRLQKQKRGEIIDASMTLVASIDEAQSSMKNAAAARRRRGGKKKGKRRFGRGRASALSEDELPDADEWAEAKDNVLSMLAEARSPGRRMLSQDEFDMDPMSSLVSRKVFAKLEIQSQEHPFFKRVWVGRHVLDHDSPLLNEPAKEMVRLNNGHWPRELNSALAVRASVQFDQILISMSGTSNADCNTVYAQKIYGYADLCVGYKFVNILFRDRTGALTVDEELIDVVEEQSGGGGENLTERERMELNSQHRHIFIL